MSKTTFITQTEEASTGVVGGGRKRAVRSPHGVLVVERSATLLGVEYAVRDTFVIGKKDADITLTDSLVSRRHARLLVQNSQVSIEDLGSTNGTFIRRSGGLVIEVNGSPEVLEDGDEVLLGPPDEPSAVVLRYKRGTN
ncbi:FHA domain-containing protein [Chloroflexus sp.]|uniref:FHA domain-containing protein n=1 Tax=Chloroflexus sp. TaxID=1904827 RepID=UPI00258DF61B|nr:FHA domain-containing protein [Chloroflexus sp.]